MSILPLLRDPDPRLRKLSRRIGALDKDIRQLAGNMLDTMYQHGGCGLAAPQVNTRLRLIVVDISSRGDSPLVLINPIIARLDNELSRHEEGCLSIPGLYAAMRRPASVVVTALALTGKCIELEASGWLGAVVQHEIDHLDGKLLTDAVAAKELARYRKQTRQHAEFHRKRRSFFLPLHE